MKLEDLKNSRLGNRSGHPWLFGLFVQDFGLPAVQVTFGDVYDFNDPQTALLAAARFRASEEMYAELQTEYEFLVSIYNNSNVPISIQDGAEQRAKEIRAALAMADNTKEKLPL